MEFFLTCENGELVASGGNRCKNGIFEEMNKSNLKDTLVSLAMESKRHARPGARPGIMRHKNKRKKKRRDP